VSLPAPKNPWFSVLAAVARPRATLVCFPFGGGNSSTFRPWSRYLPADVQLLGVDLPGRGARFGEAMFTRVDDVIDALLAQRNYLARQGRLIFFGHSLGALLAFELACALERSGAPAPVHLIASGRGAPHLPRLDPPVHGLPNAQFIEQVKRFQGLPDEVLQHEELLELFLPILRADFALSESYRCTARARLSCDLTALGGTRDPMVGVDTLAPWGKHTRGQFQLHTFDGGHFFVNDFAAEVTALALHGEPEISACGASTGRNDFSPSLTS
jgi:medium-chain acyl-[acyl-carrier-protein] hydrolase